MDKRIESCDFTISWGTIFKVFAACLIALTAIRTFRFLELIGLAVLLAIALRPLFQWVLDHKWPKWAGVCLCAAILFGTTAIILGIIVPALANEGGQFITNLPEYKNNLLQHLSRSGPMRNIANETLGASPFSDPQPLLKKIVSWSGSGLEMIAGFLAVLVLAIYFVADGGRVYRWLTAFLPRSKRLQLDNSTDEITAVVSRYIGGSAFTAFVCAVYAFTVLSLLKVPNAALLAVIAGVFDVLPIIGFFIFTLPAVLVALTVSPQTAFFVFLLFGAYHLTEAYFIVPRVYGNRLKLSGLTVLLCSLCAGFAAGVLAIILVLPLVACYPIAERIWLKPYLERDTIRKHKEIRSEDHSAAARN